MSDIEAQKIVFLMYPNDGYEQLRDIKSTILKFLCHFCKRPPANSPSRDKGLFSDNVRWSYRFLGSTTKNYSTVQDWKDVSYTEICTFEEELEKQFSSQPPPADGSTVNQHLTNGASLLADALKAIVYDYSWDNYGLISPVKRLTRKSTQSTRLSGLMKRSQNIQNTIENMVVVVSPVPKCQPAIDMFFNWDGTDLEYVSRKLMPPHLKSYFKEKYKISLFWIDTSDLYDHKSSSNDLNGMSILRSFLWSLGGDIMPIAFFSDCKKGCASDTFAAKELGTSVLFHAINVSSGPRDPKESNLHKIHVAKTIKLPDSSVKVQKLFTLSFCDMDTIHKPVRSLMNQPCSLCSGQCTAGAEKLKHEIKSSNNGKSIRIVLDETSQNNNEENGTKSSPEDVLVILGRFLKGQLPELLDQCGFTQFFSIWCQVKWSSIYDGFEANVVGKSFIAEVYKYCTTCGSETSIEDLGMKYAIIDIKGTNIATVTYFQMNSSALLSGRYCESQSTNEYSITSPVKNAYSPRVAKMSFRDSDDLARFCPSMLESWWLTNPLTDEVCKNIVPQKSRKPNLAHHKLMKDLQKLYKVKSEPVKDQPMTDPTSTESSSSIPDSDAMPKLDEILLNAVEMMVESEMQSFHIDAAIQATNSIFAAVTSTISTPKPAIDEYIQRLRSMECYYSLTEVKKFEDKRKQITLSVMQILILLKIAQMFPLQNNAVDIVEDISAHLRSISLTAGHMMMKNFLETVMVEMYSGLCGKLLYDVHNELMLPAPENLRKYSNDEETTFNDSVLWSCGSFASQSSSNVGSSKSCRAGDIKSRRQRFSATSSSQSHRIIKIPSQSSEPSSKPIDKDKSKREKVKLISSGEPSITSKAEAIKRDLFSVQDEPNDEKHIMASPDPKKRRDISVSDTPNVKQRMTALTRQRLRLHKQKITENEIGGTKIVEESPAKTEDESGLKMNDSKRMELTRKHSFYCDGTDSRSITRAKSLQQHNQAVLATPLVNNANKGLMKSNYDSDRKYSSNLGRRSLYSLFDLPIKSSTSSTDAQDYLNTDASSDQVIASMSGEGGTGIVPLSDDDSLNRESGSGACKTRKSKRLLFNVEPRDDVFQTDSCPDEESDMECKPFQDEEIEEKTALVTEVNARPPLRRSSRKRKLFTSSSD